MLQRAGDGCASTRVLVETRASPERPWQTRPMSTTACPQCGFDPADYTDNDARTADRWLGAMASQVVEGVELSLRAETTHLELRSIVEDHEPSVPDLDRIHEALHLLRRLGRELHESGAGVVTQQGSIAQINASDGGVPKQAVDAADVSVRGLVGDRQDNRMHHGRPFQALCLWSAEVIGELAAEGHPIGPGRAGENVTVTGIDWREIRPGGQLLLGEVECELSAWAVPCRKNDQWFTGRSDRIDHDLHPGWSRIYAWVLEPGTIRTGDPVVIEP